MYLFILSEPVKEIIKSTSGGYIFMFLFNFCKCSLGFSQIHKHCYSLNCIVAAVQLFISSLPPRLFCWIKAAVHVSIELLLCSPSKTPGQQFNGHAHSLPLHLTHNEVNYMLLRSRPFVTPKLCSVLNLGPARQICVFLFHWLVIRAENICIPVTQSLSLYLSLAQFLQTM